MAGPGKRNKGKAKGKGNNKRAAGIESPENEFLSTFKIINLCVETPHEAFPQDQEHFFLYLLSKRFLQNLEDYIAGKRNNPPSGDVNHDILKKIDDKEKFFWSNKPTEFNEYLTGGLKCWNDYIPVCDAAWDFITESYPSTTIYRRFHLGRKGFSPDFVVPEKVIIKLICRSI